MSNKSKSKSKRPKNKMKDNFPYIIGGSLALALAYGIYANDNVDSDSDSDPNPPPSYRDMNDLKKITGCQLYDGKIYGQKLKKFLNDHGYVIYNVKGDGNCFFHALSVGLYNKEKIFIQPNYLRNFLVNYILQTNKQTHFQYETADNKVENMYRERWKNMMKTDGTYADGLVVLGTQQYLINKHGLNLIIYHENMDDFRKNLAPYEPIEEELENTLILYHTGNHYMAIVKRHDRSFGNIRSTRTPKRHRRSGKYRKL